MPNTRNLVTCLESRLDYVLILRIMGYLPQFISNSNMNAIPSTVPRAASMFKRKAERSPTLDSDPLKLWYTSLDHSSCCRVPYLPTIQYIIGANGAVVKTFMFAVNETYLFTNSFSKQWNSGCLLCLLFAWSCSLHTYIPYIITTDNNTAL